MKMLIGLQNKHEIQEMTPGRLTNRKWHHAQIHRYKHKLRLSNTNYQYNQWIIHIQVPVDKFFHRLHTFCHICTLIFRLIRHKRKLHARHKCFPVKFWYSLSNYISKSKRLFRQICSDKLKSTYK